MSTTAALEWAGSLRDSSTCTWSWPVRPTYVEHCSTPKTSSSYSSLARFYSPKGTQDSPSPRGYATGVTLSHHMEDARLSTICQKTAETRTDADIRYVMSQMHEMCSFFRCWTEQLQRELARLMVTETYVRRELVTASGSTPNKLYFVLNGRISVTVPDRDQAEGSGARVLAVLQRGDTFGEATLLAPVILQCDMVVQSSTAMLLSIQRDDLQRCFKELLGYRPADRLLYLRVHPLFSDLSHEELEEVADRLQGAFLPPGVSLWPSPDNMSLCFLAEGECVVKRIPKGGTAPAIQPPRKSVYDGNSVARLGLFDMFGFPGEFTVNEDGSTSGPPWLIESFTDVKVFYLDHADYHQLPSTLKQVLEDENAFKRSYFEGRLQGLAKMDLQRLSPAYGAFKMTRYDVSLANYGIAVTLERQVSEVKLSINSVMASQAGDINAADLDNPALAQQRLRSRKLALAQMAAQQVVMALEREAAMAEVLTKTSSPPLRLSLKSPHKSKRGKSRETTSPGTGHSSGALDALSASLAPSRASWPCTHSHDHAVEECGLSRMAPDQNAFPRVRTFSSPHRRAYVGVSTDSPRPASTPYTLRERHAAIFMAAQNAALLQIQTDSSDDGDYELPSHLGHPMFGSNPGGMRLNSRRWMNHGHESDDDARSSGSSFDFRPAWPLTQGVRDRVPSATSSRPSSASSRPSSASAVRPITSGSLPPSMAAVNPGVAGVVAVEAKSTNSPRGNLAADSDTNKVQSWGAPSIDGSDMTRNTTPMTSDQEPISDHRTSPPTPSSSAPKQQGHSSLTLRTSPSGSSWRPPPGTSKSGGVNERSNSLMSMSPPAPPVNLPPSVVLGYEGLDPFQWAALMSSSTGPKAPPQKYITRGERPKPTTRR